MNIQLKRILIALLMTGFCMTVFSKSIFDKKKLFTQIDTPDTEFFGSIVFRNDASHPWLCVFNNQYAVEIIPWGHKAVGDYWDPVTEYRLYAIDKDSRETLIDKTVVTDKNGRTGLRIEQDYTGGVHITVANGKEIFNERLDKLPPIAESSTVSVYGEGNGAKFTALNRFEKYPPRYMYVAPDSMTDDKDPATLSSHTGRWKYLDRVSPDNRKAVFSGAYTFDITEDPNSPDILLIVYVDGAIIDRNFWDPGQIKGRLYPTGFPGHYNLTWYDSRRREVWPGECSATFEGINMLTLDFPILKCQMRFEKELPKQTVPLD